ncbi:MAG: response regulator [Lachnospiraceae bacterium]
MRIMAVDDEKGSLAALTEAIKEAAPGAEVHGFGNGMDAWEAVQNTSYDMIFIDISLRGMNGVELAKRIHERYPPISIFFETGELESKLKEQGIQTERCIYKIVTAEEVKEKIEMIPFLPPFEI